MLVELIENGIEAEKRKQQEFFELAERFRTPPTPRKQSALAMNLAAWFLAGNAQDRPVDSLRRTSVNT